MSLSPFVQISEDHSAFAASIRDVKVHGTKVFVGLAESQYPGVRECSSPEEARDAAQKILKQVEAWYKLKDKK